MLKIFSFFFFNYSKIRSWMDEQNLIFSEKKKDAKMKVLAAKDKVITIVR